MRPFKFDGKYLIVKVILEISQYLERVGSKLLRNIINPLVERIPIIIRYIDNKRVSLQKNMEVLLLLLEYMTSTRGSNFRLQY